jgi:tRNA pseudouridine13 synthase
MKLKQQPEDFRVEELTDLKPGRHGVFAFYRLEKTGWSTPDALAAIRRRWKVDLHRMSYGGLKDRHARTVQYLTIFRGPARDLEHQQIRLSYLGQTAEAYTSTSFRANRFVLTLRDMPPSQQEGVEERLQQLLTTGVPNYFDDQRFGSYSGPGGQWIARLLIEAKFEEALQVALTAPYEHDRLPEKQEKQLLRDHWGQWETLKNLLERGHARSLVDYLRLHPSDFKGAVIRLRPELRGLYLSAYQSYLWNRLLARWLERHVGAEGLREVPLRTGVIPFPRLIPPEIQTQLNQLALPLPSARWKPEADDPRRALVEEVLADEGLSLERMQVRGVRELFFSRGERPALALLDQANWTWAADDRHPGQMKLILRFELPRGAYATMVVKAALEEGHRVRASRLGGSS